MTTIQTTEIAKLTLHEESDTSETEAATRHQENFAQMSGNISTNDPAGKEFSANYATKSTRTL